MRAYIREIVAENVKTLFCGADAETVLSWWIANEGRRPVVVVGSGFSRNAVYKRTKAPVIAADVPLWAEVSRAFADDLRIHDTSGIDPLTLAELHRDGVGERRFVDMLRTLLPDDKLAPGRAHEALFNFDIEAIVTTNYLDTLLDRDPRCVPIFDDQDVARRIDKPRQIEVIYFHGHRSSPATWVASRSQYEDLPSTRPMILARVRQLLSQHPVLTVGFGLADPDFHQIYRQISLDMKATNPLGLALLGPATDGELNSEHEASQRRHWERLGIRIARFSKWDFPRFFGMTNKITVEQLKDKIANPKRPFSDRIKIAKSAFEDPDVDRYVETYRGWENAVWRKCIAEEFGLEELEEVKQRMRRHFDAQFGGPGEESEVRVIIGGGGQSRVPDNEPTFRHAPRFEGRCIQKDWELGWLAYHWLTTHKESPAEFASWLYYRVQHEYWDQRERGNGDADIEVANLLGAVWRTIDDRTDEKGRRPHRREAIEQLKGAHRFLLRYEAAKQAEEVEKDIKALGGTVDSVEERPPEAAHMKAAFLLMMNGRFSDATKQYDIALKKAVCGGDPLLSWLAAWGRHDAHRRLVHSLRRRQDADSEKERERDKEYWRERKVREAEPTVVRWKEEAELRITELRRKTLEDLQNNARNQGFERRGFSFSTTPYFAWRVFRDLESRDAPPGLQEHYLKPLLDHGGFPQKDALCLRLRFGMKGTRDWLAERIDEAAATIGEGHERDQAFVAVWHESWTLDNATNTTIVAAIDAMKPLLSVLDITDAQLPLQLLRDKANTIGEELENYRGWHAIQDDVATAWIECAASLRNKDSFDALRQYAEANEDGLFRDVLDSRIGELPWYSWMVLGVATPDELVGWLCRHFGQGQGAGRAPTHRAIEGIGNGILQVVGNVADTWRPLSPESWGLVAEWCRQALDGDVAEKHDIDWLSPILHLIMIQDQTAGSRGDAGAWREIDDKAFKKLQSAWRGTPADGAGHSMAVSVLSCLSIITKYNDSRWKSFAKEAWLALVDRWQDFLAFVRDNPFRSPNLGWFLAAVVDGDFDGHRAEAGERLLELWPVSSTIHYSVAQILEPKFWPGESWSKVVSHLREALGGARGRFSASWRMAIASLLQQNLLHRNGDLPADLWFLVEHVTILVAHEETLVANHAAYAAVFCCDACTDEEQDRAHVLLLERTLEAMANDSRLPVRHAAAYAGGRLLHTAKSERLKDCARRIHDRLQSEPHLILKTQAELGAAEGAARSRRPGPSSTP